LTKVTKLEKFDRCPRPAFALFLTASDTPPPSRFEFAVSTVLSSDAKEVFKTPIPVAAKAVMMKATTADLITVI